MAFESSIKDFGITEILQMIGSENKTGVLNLQQKEEETSIFFDRGKIVWLESSDIELENVILEVLKKQGRISGKESFLLKWKKKRQKFSSTILAQEAVTSEELHRITSFCISEAIYPLFRWKEGKYIFHQQKTRINYDKTLVTPLSTENIVMEGVRQLDEWNRIKADVPLFDVAFKKVTEKERLVFVDKQVKDEDIIDEEMDFSEIFEEDSGPEENLLSEQEIPPDGAILLKNEQMVVFSSVNGKYTIRDISQIKEISAFEVSKIITELLKIGLVDHVVKKTAHKNNIKKDAFRNRLFDSLSFSFIAISLFFMLFFLKRQIYFSLISSNHLKYGVNQIQSSLNFRRREKVIFAIEVYRLQNKHYPESLLKLVESKSNLLESEYIFDLWGNKYSYKRMEDGYRL